MVVVQRGLFHVNQSDEGYFKKTTSRFVQPLPVWSNRDDVAFCEITLTSC